MKFTRLFILIFFLAACDRPVKPGKQGETVRKEIKGNSSGAVVHSEGTSAYWEKYQACSKLIGEGKYDDAIVIYRGLVVLENNKAMAYTGLGSCYHLKMNYDSAFVNYSKALELDPEAYNSNLGMGTAFFSREKYANAVIYYTKAREIAPDVADPYWGLAICYDKLNDTAQAKENARQFIRLAPDSKYRAGLETILKR
jgi:tetratricopeptide (TPR) repeat protein